MVVLKNVLVATDFSEPSVVAMAYGRDLARSYGSSLHVLHVVEDVMTRYGPEMGIISPQVQADLEATARRDLEAAITDDDRRTLTVTSVVETHTNIPGGIVDYARRNQIDLIVVGTHGRGAMKQLLMGSVAERVVRTAPCPVLAVRERERDFIHPDAMVAVAHGPTVDSKPAVIKSIAAGLAQSSHFTRNNRDEAVEIFAKWVPGTDVAIGKKAVKHISFDPRMSPNVLRAFENAEDEVLTNTLKGEPRLNVPSLFRPEFMQQVEKEHPDYFADLPALK